MHGNHGRHRAESARSELCLGLGRVKDGGEFLRQHDVPANLQLAAHESVHWVQLRDRTVGRRKTELIPRRPESFCEKGKTRQAYVASHEGHEIVVTDGQGAVCLLLGRPCRGSATDLNGMKMQVQNMIGSTFKDRSVAVFEVHSPGPGGLAILGDVPLEDGLDLVGRATINTNSANPLKLNPTEKIIVWGNRRQTRQHQRGLGSSVAAKEPARATPY